MYIAALWLCAALSAAFYARERYRTRRHRDRAANARMRRHLTDRCYNRQPERSTR